jgi:hypothetical protein
MSLKMTMPTRRLVDHQKRAPHRVQPAIGHVATDDLQRRTRGCSLPPPSWSAICTTERSLTRPHGSTWARPARMGQPPRSRFDAFSVVRACPLSLSGFRCPAGRRARRPDRVGASLHYAAFSSLN